MRKVLGSHMLGKDAPEIIQRIAIAVVTGATKADFDRTIGIGGGGIRDAAFSNPDNGSGERGGVA
jgi:hypothetical protein